MIKLRDYQIECVEKILNMKSNEKKIVELPTGAGKTIIMSELSRRINKKLLIVVDSTELRIQTLEKLKLVCGDNIEKEVGIVQGNLNQIDKRITICTRQTLSYDNFKRLNSISNDYDYIIIDECHCAIEQQRKLLERVNCKVVGFSATPFDSRLTEVYDDFIYRMSIEEMIEKGYLSTIKAYRIKTNIDISNVKTSCGDLQQNDLDEAINIKKRNKLIVDAWKEKASSRKKTIVYCNSISHAKFVADEFNNLGINAASIDSTLDEKERAAIIESFRNKDDIKVLTNCSVLVKGIDIPEIDCIITPVTKSRQKWLQCLGRGLRLHKDKENLLVLDMVDNYKHDLVNCNNIFDLDDGFTLEEMKVKREQEKIERKRRLEEIRLLEEQEEKLRLEEINLFNKSIFNIKNKSNLDWFYNTINDKYNISILSANPSIDFYIVQADDTYISYKFTKLENYKTKLEELEKNDNLLELLEYVEKKAIQLGSSFINKHSRWKREPITLIQEKIVYKYKERIKTKWQCHKFISKRNSYFALKDIF